MPWPRSSPTVSSPTEPWPTTRSRSGWRSARAPRSSSGPGRSWSHRTSGPASLGRGDARRSGAGAPAHRDRPGTWRRVAARAGPRRRPPAMGDGRAGPRGPRDRRGRRPAGALPGSRLRVRGADRTTRLERRSGRSCRPRPPSTAATWRSSCASTTRGRTPATGPWTGSAHPRRWPPRWPLGAAGIAWRATPWSTPRAMVVAAATTLDQLADQGWRTVAGDEPGGGGRARPARHRRANRDLRSVRAAARPPRLRVSARPTPPG